MNFKFVVENDLLKTEEEIILYSGNMNTYTFELELGENWQNYIKYATFIKNGIAYNVIISDNSVLLPAEILETPGDVIFGIFGNSDGDEALRISTNLISFKVRRGAYCSGNMVIPPSKDLWEQLVTKTVPKIGENGNWYIYDMNEGCYVDTGTRADGYDYSQAVMEYVDNAIGEVATALDEIIAIQNMLIGGVSE